MRLWSIINSLDRVHTSLTHVTPAPAIYHRSRLCRAAGRLIQQRHVLRPHPNELVIYCELKCCINHHTRAVSGGWGFANSDLTDTLYIAVNTVHLASCMLCPYSHMSFFAQLFYFAMRPFDGPVKAAQVQPAATDSNCPSQALTSQPGVIAAIVLASCALAVSCALAYRALRRPSPAKSLTLTSPMLQ